MKSEIGSYRGTPTKAVIDDNYGEYLVLLPKAIETYLRSFGSLSEIHPHVINEQVQAGMRDRFACRSFESGTAQYDSHSHSYKWWCEGWAAMDKAITTRISNTKAATPIAA